MNGEGRTIALMTDFGTRDPYVAAMKGVIASRTAATIADLSHDLEPFDVFAAAWFLRAVVPYWEKGTIFVVVVDPGVGTSRRIIAVESEGRTYLAPDNGLLSLVAAAPAVSVENDSFFLPRGSTTFHGRDRFAPVAAAIANGVALGELGPRIEEIAQLDHEPAVYECARACGRIVAIDRFGNAITDLEAARLPFARYAASVRGVSVSRMARAYGEAPPGGPFLIVGSTGCIEISVAGGSAAALLQLSRGDRVTILPR